MAEATKKSAATQSSTSGGMGDRGRTTETQPSPATTTAAPTGGIRTTPGATDGKPQDLMQQVRSTATDALHTAKTNTTAKIEEKKSMFSSGLSNVAENVRKLGDGLSSGGDDKADPLSRFAADYSGMAAEKLDTVADYFNSHDLNAIYRDTESLARRNPALVIGGAFALGFLAARFFKSSSERRNTYDEGSTRGGMPNVGSQPRTQTSTI